MLLKNLAEKYNYTCYWCKQRFELEDLSRDHVEPIAYKKGHHRRGGGSSRKHGKILLACIFCNQKRGSKTFLQFKYELAEEKRRHRERFN